MGALSVFRQSFRAYVDEDKAALEAILADDFHFTSPLDNRLERATYLDVCWPNSAAIVSFDERLALESGDQACIAYEARTRDGKRFRNCEIATVRGDKLISVEVYFGWNVPHRVGEGRHAEDAEGAG